MLDAEAIHHCFNTRSLSLTLARETRLKDSALAIPWGRCSAAYSNKGRGYPSRGLATLASVEPLID